VKREAMMKTEKITTQKPTTDVLPLENKTLDEQIAMKAKMKKYLSADQFAKWMP
jgi:hypothetical protein